MSPSRYHWILTCTGIVCCPLTLLNRLVRLITCLLYSPIFLICVLVLDSLAMGQFSNIYTYSLTWPLQPRAAVKLFISINLPLCFCLWIFLMDASKNDCIVGSQEWRPNFECSGFCLLSSTLYVLPVEISFLLNCFFPNITSGFGKCTLCVEHTLSWIPVKFLLICFFFPAFCSSRELLFCKFDILLLWQKQPLVWKHQNVLFYSSSEWTH